MRANCSISLASSLIHSNNRKERFLFCLRYGELVFIATVFFFRWLANDSKKRQWLTEVLIDRKLIFEQSVAVLLSFAELRVPHLLTHYFSLSKIGFKSHHFCTPVNFF